MANAYDTLNTILTQFGLQTLAGNLQDYMKQGITDQTTLLANIRSTPEYKARFPAMTVLNQKARGFSEADYINYERSAASTEQEYGFPSGFLTDPHRIQEMLEKDVSASEVTSRAKINAAVAMDAPQETKDALQRLYGLDQGAVAAFYFDPENSVGYLEKQAASAQIAGAAARQQVDIDRTTAETLQAQGISEAQALSGFATVQGLTGLEYGTGEAATQADLVGAAFGQGAAAQKVQRVQQGRVNQFAGGGGAQAVSGGVAGLGSSASK